jgi:ubiquinone/menaquinone biosynthesis C-methylase UbiE
MALARVPEPELMDSATEADDYDRMDFRAVNDRFVQDAHTFLGAVRALLDVGTGTGRIPLAYLAHARPERFVALDAAPAMLARAEKNRTSSASEARVAFVLGNATALPFAESSFEGAFSNSLVHHLPDPIAFFAEVRRVLEHGGRFFVRDLARPASEAMLHEQTATYAAIPASAEGEDRARFERQRTLFHASLHAAFTVAEVHAMAARAGLEGAEVAMTSDRHWTLTWKKP